MTLDLYIARRFLGMVARVFGVFLGILLLIDMIDQLRRHSDPGISLGDALYLAALNVPESLYRIMPLIMILAAIALFLGLSRSSEMVVIRAAGRSGLRFLLSPVLTAALVGALTVAVFNPLVAATSREYQTQAARHAGAEQSAILSVSAEGLWMRQGDAQGQTVIRAGSVDAEGLRFDRVTFQLFAPDGTPRGRIEAARARLEPGAWRLEDAKHWDLTAANPELAAQRQDSLTLPTDLTPEKVREGLGTPASIAFWDLPAEVADLERAGFSARAYRLLLQMELALPLLLVAMVLLAAGFTMRHARFGKSGQMVLYALLGGFLIFFLRNFAQVLGENGQIPIVIAAWSPPVAAFLLALSLLLHLEDG